MQMLLGRQIPSPDRKRHPVSFFAKKEKDIVDSGIKLQKISKKKTPEFVREFLVLCFDIHCIFDFFFYFFQLREPRFK